MSTPDIDLSQRDFIFPALRNNPIALQKWILSLSFSYSRRWNSRRLEHHCYAIWNAVLTHLTEDQAALLVIPQFVVWFVDRPKHAPDISFRTVAEQDAQERIPDFVVAHISAHPRPSPLNLRRLQDFRNLEVHLVNLPILIEVKRFPSRRQSRRAFKDALMSKFHMAALDLDLQASYLFRSDTYMHQKQVILVACVGEWWRWKVAERDAPPRSESERVNDKDEDDEGEDEDECDSDEEDEDKDKDEGEDKDEVEVKVKVEVDEDVLETLSESESDGSDELNITSKEPQLDGGWEEPVHDDAKDAWPDVNEWSSNIRLGTPASNQRFFLLHKYLTELSRS